jgi:hypothetical protein
MTPGQKFREAVRRERPLQVAGAIHALAAKLAEEAGFRALYVSGAGVANASFGKPDLGLTTLEQVYDELKAKGVKAETLGRIYAPIGLDVGSDSPAEIAVSVMAEILQVLRKAKGGHLKI